MQLANLIDSAYWIDVEWLGSVRSVVTPTRVKQQHFFGGKISKNFG
jgi:hypothetical protein